MARPEITKLRITEKAMMLPDLPGCWLWLGAMSDGGYGLLSMGRHARPVRAHRASFQAFKHEIPQGAHVLHSCDTPSCVNPAHLRVGTRSDNMKDAFQRQRLIMPKNPQSRGLTPADVVNIRHDPRSHRIVAAAYGLDYSTVGHIRRRKIWKHVP